jgi:hypothetical protein
MLKDALVKLAKAKEEKEKKHPKASYWDSTKARWRAVRERKDGKINKILPGAPYVKRTLIDTTKGALAGGGGGAALGALIAKAMGKKVGAGAGFGGGIGAQGGSYVGAAVGAEKHWRKRGIKHDGLDMKVRLSPEARAKYIDAFKKRKERD